ncbi:Serine hydroxymethyltransferase, mitochondrial [Zancudomyces culisetae]|uniref:Serine hydroxymethyltransferase n=1 Tax=Zancudomyces culisetae TaxID=1213189 RepID=A0A1R1PR25_ZANCU|nr:Serine hydroxymethyltransferase, mitochondrial [Zancudomyces culisetae]|eukprot:OMH83417.1 Serine hydroxymethyltransferase, mitochondrial [Zancudomyces culisetae]
MVSSYFETLPYHCNTETGLIDYDELEKSALVYRPKIIVAGASAYARAMDYARLREICDKVGCYLMADIAHISGLVAAKVMPGPFEHADIVTTTTHKSLRGPRGAMIFFRKGEREVKKKGASAKKTGPVMYDLEQPINASVFPGHQGGPHNHTITALAVALKQAQSPEFIQYQQQVLDNSKALAKSLIDRGFQLATGGTDNHLILADVMSSKGIDGARSERVLELASIITNKNTIVGDRSAVIPSGIRMGTPAMTSRGLVEKDFEQIAKFFDQGVKIAHDLAKTRFTASKFGMFKTELGSNVENVPELAALKKDVVSFSSSFPTVGFGKADMKL